MSVIRTEVRTTIRDRSYGDHKEVNISLERTRSPDGTNFELNIFSLQGDGGRSIDFTLRDLTIEDLQGLREALQLIPLEGSCQ